MLRASPTSRNQCAERHSRLTVALNDSAKALSTGFPGREKTSSTLFQYGPGVEGLRRELRSVVDPDPGRQRPSALRDFSEDPGDVRSGERPDRFQSHALPRVGIHDRQDSHRPAVGKRVVHEVHRPDLVRRLRPRLLDPPRGTPPPLRPPSPKAQSFLDVEPIERLVVDPPPLPTQVHVQRSIAGVNAKPGQLPQTPQERLPGRAAAPVTNERSANSEGPTGSPLRHSITGLGPRHHDPALRGPYHFFRRASCSIVRSSVRSATIDFSFRFSSRT